MSEIPELRLSLELESLIKHCERNCVAECCGFDAFDFSPIHFATHLSISTGSISTEDLEEWEQRLAQLEEDVDALPATGEELICSIGPMNQFFTRKAVRAFLRELKTSLRAAPKVLELSDQLAAGTRAWQELESYNNRVSRKKLPK